ncbi:MAG: TRAFs-binding domain-containing protein [Roseobacter sp.]
MTSDDELRPVCFIAMPFRTKRVVGARDPAPSEVDFDALWDKVYRPAITAAGYTAVRADFDTGSVIIKDMVERLAYADLVLADVSLPNGNVYYEVGLRHAARDTGCILFAADWSQQLFDIEQFTAVRYPLAQSVVTDTEAEAIQKMVTGAIQSMKASKTPWFEFVEDPRGGWSGKDQSVFRAEAVRLADFQADFRAIRLEGDKATQKKMLHDKVKSLKGSASLKLPQAAIEMMIHIRDIAQDWDALVAFIDALSPDVRALPVMQEQRLFALSNAGDPATAAAHMEKLIDQSGPTPERLGILGGRYKRLWLAARQARLDAGKKRPSLTEGKMLDRAIDAYHRGMMLDFNAYYCSCNLPLLYTARNEEDDLERAHRIDHLVVAACQRAIDLGEDDNWTRPTLLGAAVRAQDVKGTEKLLLQVAKEGAATWKIDTTISDLNVMLGLMADGPDTDELREIVEELDEMLEE